MSLSRAELAEQERLRGRSLLKKKKIELGDMPGPSDTDRECGEWQVGTATGECCSPLPASWAAAGGAMTNSGSGASLPDLPRSSLCLPVTLTGKIWSWRRAAHLRMGSRWYLPTLIHHHRVSFTHRSCFLSACPAGYSTDGTDHGDKPMAPNDLGEYVVP